MPRVSAHHSAPAGKKAMSSGSADADTIGGLDGETHELVRLAVTIALGSEPRLREAMRSAMQAGVRPEWVEEIILQSYLFAGFPRALNAAREWRRASGRTAPQNEPPANDGDTELWRKRGEATCEVVYGEFYQPLRHNIRDLHPALDEWMIVDGYGKVLSREALDLRRRELCIVAVCAAAEQSRQLHSHLHGARNAGASPGEVDGALAVADEYLDADARSRVRLLWARVRGK
ncbi:MAG TPA: carboxymuconolactone decarboxylase family protein [Gemmatimonadaceae bacterium]|nr:carboxymuconolactone decarboxylase family protein [Gemmatimonadaceae bacterium]